MNNRPANRSIKTHLDRDGIVIFRLLQGDKKPRTVHTFGYGTHHGIWLRLEGLGSGIVTMTTEPAAVVKEQIAEWRK